MILSAAKQLFLPWIFSINPFFWYPADRSHGSKLNIHTCSIYDSLFSTIFLHSIAVSSYDSSIFTASEPPSLLCIVGIFVPNHSQKDHKAIQLSNFRLKDQFRLMAKGENLSIILWKSQYFGLKQHKNIKNAILNVLKCQKNLLFSFLLLYPKRGKCTQ